VAVAVPTEDTTIEAASHQARATLDEFKKAIANTRPEQTDFSVRRLAFASLGTNYEFKPTFGPVILGVRPRF
jgi:hypothetical protein